MRKRVLSITLCVALLLGCLAGLSLPAAAATNLIGAAATDLIGDGDFESSLSKRWTWEGTSDKNIKDYAIVAEGISPITVAEENGNHYLKFPATTDDSGAYTTYTKYIFNAPIVAQKKYRITLRYKGAGLHLYFHTSIFTEGKGLKTLPEAADWTEYTHVFTTREAALTTTNTAIGIGHSATAGTGYVDDIKLFEVIDPQSVSFDQSVVTLGKGQKQQLAVSAQPEGAEVAGAVSFTSSNTAVATVDDNGVVTAVANGVSYISATVGDFSTSCTVIVDAYTPITIGDFEGTITDNWQYNNSKWAILHADSPIKVLEESNGNHCLHLPSTGAKYEKYYQKFGVEADKTYKITLRYKGTGGKLVLGSCASGGGPKDLGTVEKWTTFSYEFTMNSAPNLNFSFGFIHSDTADGDAYIDDVKLQEVSPSTELVVDGDFQSENLAANWANFIGATDFVSLAQDPADSSNYCLRVTGEKVQNYKSLAGTANSTYYRLTLRFKGTGKLRISLTEKFVLGESVVVEGVEDYTYTTGTTNNVLATAKANWQTISVVYKTSAASNPTWTLQLGTSGKTSDVYMDDVSVVKLGSAYTIGGLAGGSLSLTSGSTTATTLNGLLNKAVTVNVTPAEGYLMVPGSLRYLDSNNNTYRILNKNTADFGMGNGNTFAFNMPTDNVRILADFVKADTQDFAWGTIGTSLHYNNSDEIDGIRFLTRVNLDAFDASANGFSLTYGGETYAVKRLGLLLKRTENEMPLTLESLPFYENAVADERMWGVDVYTSESNTFRLTDYTDTYFDYTIAMTTKNPSDTFNKRVYTARGYLVLEKDGEETVVYANERSDNVNTVLARLQGAPDDTVIGGEVEPEEPEEDEVTVPADDKDYSNADLKVLSIGNSYSQDAHKYLQAMAAKEGKLFKCVNLYKGGCALNTHYEGWTSGEAIYNYELNGVADYNTFVSLADVLKSDEFDVITLQQSSWGSVNYGVYQPYLNNLIAALREKQPNAQIYIHQTWAYGDDSTHHTKDADSAAHTGGSMAAMWEKVEAAYNAAVAETGLPLIPAGQAIQHAQEALNAGGYSETSIQRDGAHVSYTWGRYLLARVWYQMFMGEIPDVTLPQLNSSVSANASMEALVSQAVADAFEEYGRTAVVAPTYEWQTHPQDYKLIAFGFDDLPCSVDNTTSIINTLAKYEGFATCFVMGENLQKSGASLLEYAVEKGFEIGNHSYNHPRMTEGTYKDVVSQLKKTNTLLRLKMGIVPKFFRPPYLATNDTVYQGSKDVDGMYIIKGSWHEVASAEDTATLSIENAYDGAIYVMHPASSTTAEAMETICKTLYDQGYRFCTMSQLFEYKGITPQYNTGYNDVC